MAEFDLVIRNGTVATAADVFSADIGIAGGKISALGARLAKGREEIDAQGKLVLPGGIDSHVHIAQMSSIGIPNFYRYFDNRGDRPTYVRMHNSQTLIIRDLAPLTALLKAKAITPWISVTRRMAGDTVLTSAVCAAQPITNA